MYSLGTNAQRARETYEPYGPQPGGIHEGVRGEGRAERRELRAPGDGFAYAGPQSSGQNSPAPPAMDGLLQAFGDFLRTAFDKLAQMVGGLLNGNNGGAPAGQGAAPESRGSILQPGQTLDLGCGESVSRGLDGSLELTVGGRNAFSSGPNVYGGVAADAAPGAGFGGSAEGAAGGAGASLGASSGVLAGLGMPSTLAGANGVAGSLSDTQGATSAALSGFDPLLDT